MKKLLSYFQGLKKILTLCVSIVFFALCLSLAHTVFINEIHYDNAGGDDGDSVELAGVAGLDLLGWSLLFYNGAMGPCIGIML